jgi:hypothetical protein
MTTPAAAEKPTVKLDELIDVVRIRLSNPARATALLSEFWSADRVLASWAAQPGCKQVNFEVTFFDGFVVRGSYAHFKNGRRCKPFSAHVRSLLRPESDQAPSDCGFAFARYLVPQQ